MTWKEFKEAVKAAGVKEHDEILYIDVDLIVGVEDVKNITFEAVKIHEVAEAGSPPAVREWRIWA